MKYDIIIKSGTVIDGTNQDMYKADVGIKDEKIIKIGEITSEEGIEIIDGTGKFVTPGFIDPHSHGDLSLLVWPNNEGNLVQGVTTMIGGNCGFAPAPIGEEVWEFCCWEYRSIFKVDDGYFAKYNFLYDLEKMKKQLKKDYDLDVNWKTMTEFFVEVEKKGISSNYYPLAGHNHIRAAAMGFDSCRSATDEEIDKMKELLIENLEAGAQGFSTGLDYIPGCFCTTEEVIELAKIVKEYNGIYNTHFRTNDMSTGKRDGIKGIREAIKIAKEVGIRTTLSHMSPGYEQVDKSSDEEAIEIAMKTRNEIEEANNSGIEVMYDVIPNSSGGGSTIPFLISLLKPWYLMSGTIEQFVKNLHNKDFIAMIKEQCEAGKVMLLSPTAIDDISRYAVVVGSEEENFVNKNVFELSQEMDKDAVETICEIVKIDPYAKLKLDVSGNDSSVRAFVESDIAMISSDGFAFDLDTTLDLDYPLNRFGHPNNYCYTVRYLVEYPCERFEENIYKMTGLIADWYNMKNRGTLKEGNYADVLVIDKNSLKTNENYIKPGVAPQGIDYVIVNGEITVKEGIHNGSRKGKILRKER